MHRSAALCGLLLIFLAIAAVCNGAPLHATLRHDLGEHENSSAPTDAKPTEMSMGEDGAQHGDDAKMPSDMDSEHHREHGGSASMTESDMGSADVVNSSNNQGMDGMETSESGMASGMEMSESDMDSGMEMSGSNMGPGMEMSESDMGSGMEMSESGMDSQEESSHEHGSHNGDKPQGEKPSDEEGNHIHVAEDGDMASTDAENMHTQETSTTMEESEEPEASAEESGVCIGVNMLENFAAHDLVFEKHVLARVLCDATGSCATKGHIVNFNSKGMMMATYCDIVGCKESIMEVNSPKYRRGLKIESKSENMHFTAFAAKYETRGEEAVLSAAVRMGL